MSNGVTEAVARFTDETPRFKQAAQTTRRRLLRPADDAGIKCSVTARVKDVRSFHKKILARGYADPWNDVTDKIGVRVVVEVPQDIDRVVAAIERKLKDMVLRIEDKRESLGPAVLGYSGVHVQLFTERPSNEREIVECEVQIRTNAQDAWSVVSHKILYKPSVTLPPRLQRSVYRLVALVEMFDEEVQRVMDELPSLPGYEVVDLVDIAEIQFLSVGHSPSNRELSCKVLQEVSKTISYSEREHYDEILKAYVEAERDNLAQLYSEYGPHSAVGYIADYVLFGQAESLILFERMSRKLHYVVSCWRDSGFPWGYLQALADAASISLPSGDG